MKRFLATVALLLVALASAGDPDSMLDWPYVGADQAGTKHSPASEITAANGGTAGAIVTGGGLVFIGGGAPYLYAFDKATGAEVWRGATPFVTKGNPMTYRAGSGRQFVVIATGVGTDAALVAFVRSE